MFEMIKKVFSAIVNCAPTVKSVSEPSLLPAPPITTTTSPAVPKNRHVVPHEKMWNIVAPGNHTAIEIHKRKKDAVASARLMCITSKGELVVHGKNGKIQYRNSYGNDPRGGG